MFRGNHPTRVDEKGRLKVPAEFKRVIDEKYSSQFYITSLDGKVAQLYPFEEWERIEQKLAALPTFNPTKKKFLSTTELLGTAGGDGRPGPVAAAAVAAGCGADQGRSRGGRQFQTCLEVRNLEAYRQEIETEKFTPEDEKTLDELGI